MRTLAIDPGPEQSAYLWLEDGVVTAKGIETNDWLVEYLRGAANPNIDDGFAVVIEMVASYGMPVGDRWSCATCGHEVTMESHPTLQPALGGHKQGQCPNAQCWSNKRGGKARGHAIFTIVRRSHP